MSTGNGMSKPAARLTDMHVCPMQTPAVVPIPHVGGPILFPGAPTVLIGGLPAARVGDMCMCVGPPAPIVLGSFTVLIAGKPAARVGDMTGHGGTIMPPGCPTVLIGDSGGGAASPAGLTMSAARKSGAAFTRTTCAAEGGLASAKDSPLLFRGDPTKKSWIEIELVDQKGKPVPHVRYRVVPPEKKPIEGFLDEKGFARIGGIDPGTCQVTFPDLDAASWKPETGDPGRLSKPEVVPTTRRPSIGPVKVKGIFVGKPSVGPVTVSIAVFDRPSIGPVRVRMTTPGIGPVTVKLGQTKARFVAQIPSGARDGTVLRVRGRDGKELMTQSVKGGKEPSFVTIPLDRFLTEGLVNIEIALSNGKVMNGFSVDLAALRGMQLAGAAVEQFAQNLVLGLTAAITARDDG
jgi:uncharacterized Zn-binding protein involved in type VI secretion